MNSRLKALLISVLILNANVGLALDRYWTLGTQVGGAFYRETFTTDISNLIDPFGPLSSAEVEAEDTAIFWGFLAGYQIGCLGWFFGAEANIDWYYFKRSQDFLMADGRRFNAYAGALLFERKPTVALVGRIGYKIAPYFLPYMRAGVETSEDKLESTFTSLQRNLPPNQVVLRDKARSYRVIVGVGAEFPLALPTCPAIRLEYNFHTKGKTMETNGTLRDIFGVFPTFDSTARPRLHTGSASIVWNFGKRNPY